MNGKSGVSDFFSRLYYENIGRIGESSTPIINSFRKEAIEKFNLLGVPTKKMESYKYTNLETFFRHDYQSYFIPEASHFRKAEEFRCDVTELDAHGIVLMNGFYPTINGKLRELPGGIIIGSLNAAARKYPDLIEKHYGKYARSDSDGLIHLNTAMVPDGVFIFVPRGSVPGKPVQVVNLVDSEQDTCDQHRKLIIVEENAECCLLSATTRCRRNVFLQMRS